MSTTMEIATRSLKDDEGRRRRLNWKEAETVDYGTVARAGGRKGELAISWLPFQYSIMVKTRSPGSYRKNPGEKAVFRKRRLQITAQKSLESLEHIR